MTWAPFERNACASFDAPPAMARKSSPEARYTSIYRVPMWCLCRFRAISRCSWDMKRMRASPLRLPSGDRQRATPPLEGEGERLTEDKVGRCVISAELTPLIRLINGLHSSLTWLRWGRERTWRCPGRCSARVSLWPAQCSFRRSRRQLSWMRS